MSRAWVKLMTSSAFHERVLLCGNEAWGAFCRMLAWSGEHLSDGRIPCGIADAICADAAQSDLLDAGLCERTKDGDIMIIAYLKHNESRGRVEGKWKKDRVRKSSARTPRGIRSLDVEVEVEPEVASGARARVSDDETDPRAVAMTAELMIQIPQIPDARRFAEVLLGRWQGRHTQSMALEAIGSAAADLPDTASEADARKAVRIYFDAAPKRAKREADRKSSDRQNSSGRKSEADHKTWKEREKSQRKRDKWNADELAKSVERSTTPRDVAK